MRNFIIIDFHKSFRINYAHAKSGVLSPVSDLRVGQCYQCYCFLLFFYFNCILVCTGLVGASRKSHCLVIIIIIIIVIIVAN